MEANLAIGFNAMMILLIGYVFWISKRYIHMLQLNSYMNLRYLKWYFANFKKEVVLFWAWYLKKMPEKKKFVITARVKRLYFALFFLMVLVAFIFNALLREQSFLVQGFFLLFFLIVAEFKVIFIILANAINMPIEYLISKYYLRSAKRILKKHKDLIVIGITGSYGKTSTKHILTKLLSQKYNVLMTPESYNTTMGVVRTIRERLKSSHQVFVVEMGARKKGDIKEICDLVHPQIGIITSIGPQHLETFQSIENIIQTKFELEDALPKDGTAFLNYENKWIREKATSKNAVKYGVIKNDALGIKYWAQNISYDRGGLFLELCSTEGDPLRLQTKLLGSHNVLNIIAASGVALKLGLQPHEIQYGVKRLEPVEHRLQLKQQPRGVIVIDDAYNSNPEGAKEALNILAKFEDHQRILVTPGLVELGKMEASCNFALGMQAGEAADYIVLVGENRTKPIYEGIKSVGFEEEKVYIAKDLREALDHINLGKRENSVVLFLNDLPDNY
jgi:UDP-N-acetylmuramoyl-tripeptide--D-alanyl-D-alanine ligase